MPDPLKFWCNSGRSIVWYSPDGTAEIEHTVAVVIDSLRSGPLRSAPGSPMGYNERKLPSGATRLQFEDGLEIEAWYVGTLRRGGRADSYFGYKYRIQRKHMAVLRLLGILWEYRERPVPV